MPGGSIELAPDQQAVEVRENAFDSATCIATMELGTPPSNARALDADPASGMQSEAQTTESLPATSVASASRVHRRRRAHAAATYRSQGYITTYWEDPVGIDVNKVNDGIDYYYNGSCVTSGSQAYHYYWYSPSGWGKNDDNWATSNTCTLEASSSYVLFQNDIFCVGASVYAHYSRTSIHGHKDGTLYGFWNSWVTGAPCRDLLSFTERLIRQV